MSKQVLFIYIIRIQSELREVLSISKSEIQGVENAQANAVLLWIFIGLAKQWAMVIYLLWFIFTVVHILQVLQVYND